MSGNGPAPALDLQDYRVRAHRIYTERVRAREEQEEQGIEEAEAEFEYRRRKAIRFASHRSKSGGNKGAREAEVLAEGDVAEWKLKRDTAHVLKRSAEYRIAELERNAASLRVEAQLSEGLT